ncbi:MAG: aspartate aminotransferase [Planctomycetes bacterium]|nr:aspartate aminotransferase [Planctomycetota bacterium]
MPYMGVIHVVAEAVRLGFYNGHPDWCNLGQGQPEVGELEGAPKRVLEVKIDPADCAYGPLEGTDELRGAIAAHYNRLYRVGQKSQYTAANVAVACGGRLALTRAMAALSNVSVGYQLPDYTAYEDMFNMHLDRLRPVPIVGPRETGFSVSAQQVATVAQEEDLAAYLFSNPCNPTGNVLRGTELAELVELARSRPLTLLSDEFYSHFIYDADHDGDDGGDAVAGAGPVSAASFVEDVNSDPVLIFDGLTKSYRYPGWRVGWAIGPPAMVETMARTASAIDGGPSRVAQAAALTVLEPARADQETDALRRAFTAKRNLMVRRLKEMGVTFAREPESTFYCFGSLENLPAPFNDGVSFFQRALQHKVMTVPGEYFDVNPGKQREGVSPWKQWMRFSFGPPMDNMVMGLDRLEAMLAQARS